MRNSDSDSSSGGGGGGGGSECVDLTNDFRAKTFSSRTDMPQYSYNFLAGSCTGDVTAGMELRKLTTGYGKMWSCHG